MTEKLDMPKPCACCGKMMERRVGKETYTRFAIRRFCSQACNRKGCREERAVARTKKKVTKETGAKAYDDLSHSDRTSIAHESAQIGANHAQRDETLAHAIERHIDAACSPQEDGRPQPQATDAERAQGGAPGAGDGGKTEP